MLKQASSIVLLITVFSCGVPRVASAFFSRTFANEEVSIDARGIFGRCFIFNVTNRKMEVEIESKNGAPVEVALFDKLHSRAFELGVLDFAKAAPNGDAYSLSLLRGKISAYVKADKEWCFGARSKGGPVRLHYIVRTYPRL